MTVKVRFAPSPTGYIHLGNLRTAAINWLFARKNNGVFILRFDDTDKQRARQHFTEQILLDFENLGLAIDEKHWQSQRLARYDEVFHELLAKNLVYGCHETPQELQMFRQRQKLLKRPPVYKQENSNPVKAANMPKPYYRFRLSKNDVKWQDRIRASQQISLQSISDPVIKRADKSYLYTFTSVVDDIDFGITDVIRGEDHVTNTAVQIDMFNNMSSFTPNFAHHNLLVSSTGEGFSKRDGSLSIKQMLFEGYESLTLLNYVISIGSSRAPRTYDGLEEMISDFSLSSYSRTLAHTNLEDILNFNSRKIQHLQDTEIISRMVKYGFSAKKSLHYWSALKTNCKFFADIFELVKLIEGPVKPQIVDSDYCKLAIECLPKEEWNENSFSNWVNTIAKKTRLRGKSLFMPLRLALTGLEKGPELGVLFPLIGLEKVTKRLKGLTA